MAAAKKTPAQIEGEGVTAVIAFLESDEIGGNDSRGSWLGRNARIRQTLKALNPQGATVSVRIRNKADWDAILKEAEEAGVTVWKTSDALEAASKIRREILDGCDEEAELRVLRHVAHYFDIPKGDTYLR